MAVSASKSSLLLSPCIRWAWDGAKAYESEFANTTKRDKGTDFHRIMEDYINCQSSHPSQWDDVNEWAVQAWEWYLNVLRPRLSQVATEVYVGFNPVTGKVHQNSNVRNREYPTMRGYIPGTADILGTLHDGSLYVADWKTGGGDSARDQLMTLALGFRKPGQRVVLAILYCGEQAKGCGGVNEVIIEPTGDELLQHQRNLAMQYQDIGVRKDPVPGIHCTQLYCPHLAYCPAHTDTVNTGVSDSLVQLRTKGSSCRIEDSPTGPAHAGFIMERVTAAERQLAFYKERVRQYIEQGNRCVAGDYEYSKKADGFRWRKQK